MIDDQTLPGPRTYVASEGQTVFHYPVIVLEPADLSVYKNGALSTPNVDYLAQGFGLSDGVTITYINALHAGDTVSVATDMVYTQPSDYIPGSSFSADAHEASLDRVTLLTRQNREMLSRTPRFPMFSDPALSEMIWPIPQAGKYLRASGDGMGLVWSDSPGIPGDSVDAQDVTYGSSNVETALNTVTTDNSNQNAILTALSNQAATHTTQIAAHETRIARIEVKLQRLPLVTDSPWFADPTGTVDSAPAIKACRDATGGMTVFPDGTFLILSEIAYTGGQIPHIQGNGNNHTSIVYRGNNNGFVINTYFPWICRDLGIAHDRTTGTPTAGAAFKVIRGASGDLQNVFISNPYDGVIMQPPDMSGAPNNHFKNLSIGFYERYAFGCLATDGPVGGSLTNYAFSGMAEPGSATIGPGTAIYYTGHVEAMMINYGDTTYNTYGIHLDGVNYAFADRIEYNYFDHCQIDSSRHGILVNRCALIDFSSVWCSSHQDDGMVITNSTNIAIGGGSKFYNNDKAGLRLGAGARFVNVVGNTFVSNGGVAPGTYSGIQVDPGVTDFTVMGNTLGGDASLQYPGRQKYGIEVMTGGSDRYSIIGNCVSSNVSGGVSNGGTGSNQTVMGNW